MIDDKLDPAKAFLGVGWAFPVRPGGGSGDVVMAVHEEDIRHTDMLGGVYVATDNQREHERRYTVA